MRKASKKTCERREILFFGKNIFHYLEHDNEINNHEAKMNKNVLEKC